MASDEADREIEEDYLTSDDATGLWVIIRGWTNFNRWLTAPADYTDDEYNQRLLHLLAAAVLRRVEYLVTDGDWLNLLKVTEAYAEGEATPDEFYEACEVAQCLSTSTVPAATAAAMDAVHLLSDDYKVLESIECVYDAAGYLAAVEARELDANANLEVAKTVWQSPAFLAGKAKEEKAICALIREIFGNPFHPVTLNPSWQTPTVVALATAAYENRVLPAGTLESARLAVLADAMEEAGCSEQAILDHLRSPGPHVRGCFAVDAVLAKV